MIYVTKLVNISKNIINEVNFKKFDNKKLEYFELIENDVLTDYFLNVDQYYYDS